MYKGRKSPRNSTQTSVCNDFDDGLIVQVKFKFISEIAKSKKQSLVPAFKIEVFFCFSGFYYRGLIKYFYADCWPDITSLELWVMVRDIILYIFFFLFFYRRNT